MPFILSRPPSPVPREDTQTTQDEGHALFPSSLPAADLDMGKHRPRLEILLDTPHIYLKGTGVDVEPATLSGHVLLDLAEATSVKQVVLSFKGKARVPVVHHEALSFNGSSMSYVVCSHDWAFLEGDHKHSRTLKAGRHYFPFQLQLGGSLPSSLSTAILGGASITYKLRAQVIRPGFNHNIYAIAPVTILRTFAQEALEYQQTLEIENTWPEKVMYSLMIPHKAWAVGDKLTAIVKFSPLRKGVRILTIASSIHETTRLYGKSSTEHTRVVATAKHEIVSGRAVEIGATSTRDVTPPQQLKRHFGYPQPCSSSSPPPESDLPSSPTLIFSDMPRIEASCPATHVDDELGGIDDVVTTLSFSIPLTITPTHSLEPIVVSHRIRWIIHILNPDGHTSELRCSLPLHLLDHQLLEESKRFTAPTRRLLLGEPELPVQGDDLELPSYLAHVRDRVANMYLPEAATIRVANPWIVQAGSPAWPHSGVTSPGPSSHSGYSTPLDSHVRSHLPHAPGSGDSTPLDWVNSELLLSLNREWTRNSNAECLPSHFDNIIDSEPGSGLQSRYPSRLTSRASSPIRQLGQISSQQQGPPSPPTVNPNDSYVHTSHTTRNWNTLLQASLKPLTSISHAWLPSRHSNTASQHVRQHPNDGRLPSTSYQLSIVTPNIPLLDPSTASALYHQAMAEVPDYGMAAQGFIGGVPPLDSMRGLPSYDEVQRSQNDSSF
ncbi:hypothetical protein AX16_002081 [Volvariella volvacea WC 439]|nr:hypothetical protein AX16_002081 [Volvariella volvacea WC 439]